jgi:conjugative relaxase-like TrwC/TraI family protein
MINVTALTSAKGSAHYLTHDNYYLKDDSVSSHFFGKGAENLGLNGQRITSENIESLLSGKLPSGTQIGNVDKHRPGWDVTFSAPKSVSIQSLINGDERIASAHDEAVKTALSHFEEHLTTRQRNDGHIEKYITNSLVAATFQHHTSRELDPQLHTHALVLNITQGKGGDWRSVSSESLYRMQRELDLIYKSELEAKLNNLGYETEKTNQGFEISSVPKTVIEAFSTRSKQISSELAKYNLSRDESTAKQRQIATLTTREEKPDEQNLDLLKQAWRDQANTMNWQPEPIPNVSQSLNPEITERVKHTIDVLTEKDAVICEHAIYRHLNASDGFAVSKDQLSGALNELKLTGLIHHRKLNTFDRNTRLITEQNAFVTKRGIELEKAMLSSAIKMNIPVKPSWLGKISPSLESLVLKSGYFRGGAISSVKSATKAIDAKIAISAEKNHIWTQEQRQSAIKILSHRGRLSQLQGFAGTAKTSSVLASIRDIAKSEGYKVLAVAPSHAACRQLEKDIKADIAVTTSGYLAQMKSGKLQNQLDNAKTLVIHDEAGLASTEQMQSFLSLAEKSGHRVINSGDRFQKSSIGAGSAFAQLADNKVPTYELTHIFRQKEQALKKAVEHSLPNDPKIKAGIELLHNEGQIKEIKDRDIRIESISIEYSQLSKTERLKTLVLDPTRKGVDDLNQTIRQKLQELGELSKEEISTLTLKTRDITKPDLKHGAVGSVFKIGDVVTLNCQALKQNDKILHKGSKWQVTDFNKDSNSLKLQSLTNPDQIKEITSKQLSRTHPTISELQTRQFTVGDLVKFTSTDIEKGVLTNEAATVINIDKTSNSLTIRKGDGSTLIIDSSQPLNLDHRYAQTTFSAQGLTAQNVLYHAQSTSTNLMNQRDFYVALSRATDNIKIVTDSKSELTNLIEKSTGEKHTAIKNASKNELKNDLNKDEKTEEKESERSR